MYTGVSTVFPQETHKMVTDGASNNPKPPPPVKLRVHCFVDGFNLYHALDWFNDGKTIEENHKYRKYKWISLRDLARCFIGGSEELVGVDLFTTVPTQNIGKQMRHRQFNRAQECHGVNVTHGAFREKQVRCEAHCKGSFSIRIEKQTDVNIALKMLDLAYQDAYDKAILISGDTDLIPAIKLIRERWPQKHIVAVLPIGRRKNGLDMRHACNSEIKMNESHLQRCLMLEQVIDEKNSVRVNRPIEYLPTA
jgi:uncharacterized LabA/DUF88 family protein